MSSRKFSVGASVLFIASLALTGCGDNTSDESQATGDGTNGEVATLRIGLLPNIDALPIYIGIEDGIFEKHDLEIEPVPAQGGAALLPAVLEGSVDVAYSNVLTPMTAIERGIDVKVVSGAPLTVDPDTLESQGDHPSSILAVTEESDIETAADLGGKTVSVNALGGIQEVAVRNSVDAAGGDPDSVELVELPLSQAEGALSSGRVDAISVNEPFTTAVVQAGHRIVGAPFTDFDDPASNIAIYFSTTEFADANADILQRFRDAMDETNQFINENPEEARDSLSGYTDIEESIRNEVSLPYYQSRINEASVEEIMRKGAIYGALEEELSLEPIIGDVPTTEDD